MISIATLYGAEPILPVPSNIGIQQSEGKISIHFEGTLEYAPTLNGPWNEVSGAANPYEISPSKKQGYYRSITTTDTGIFASKEIVEMSLTGPFQTHFDLAFAGLPDGIFPPRREKPYFDAQLSMEEQSWPVRVRVRGNSSLQECPFPKMKIKIKRKVRLGTPFENAREWKIGSHCAEGGQGNIGRLRDERATFREALVYETMDALEFLTPRVKRALIHYKDTSLPTHSDRNGWSWSRQAFIFDHVEVLAENLGGRALEDEEVAALEGVDFSEQLVVELKLFNALIGNWDYQLSEDGTGLWNVEVIDLRNGTMVPIAGDFDLSAWVTGRVTITAPRDYLPKLEPAERQMRFTIEEILNDTNIEQLYQASQRFLEHHAILRTILTEAIIDDEGRLVALTHLDHFYQTLNQILQ